jgi:hypothetical protein
MKASNTVAVVGAGLLIAAGGLGTAAVLGATNAATPVTTATITVGNGATGPRGPVGPAGPQGPQGPAGDAECPTGFVFGDLVINHPGGQTTIFTCIKK